MTRLASIVRTITSPVFCKFVLAFEDTHLHEIFEGPKGKRASRPVDKNLLSLSQRTGMKMIVGGRVLDAGFRDVMGRAFPLMVSAGSFEFELNDSPTRVSWPMYA
jgi:hypothetical protein